MNIKLTKYGLPQVVIFPAVIILAMLICLVGGLIYLPSVSVLLIDILLGIILVWTLSFFRDPHREPPNQNDLLLAPADGKIADIEIVEGNEFIGTPALRIGIFLNIFNVHLNRSPCKAKVVSIKYKRGKYKNAANPMAGKVNESNDLHMMRTDMPNDKIIVRQISGAIARRIVCKQLRDKT